MITHDSSLLFSTSQFHYNSSVLQHLVFSSGQTMIHSCYRLLCLCLFFSWETHQHHNQCPYSFELKKVRSILSDWDKILLIKIRFGFFHCSSILVVLQSWHAYSACCSLAGTMVGLDLIYDVFCNLKDSMRTATHNVLCALWLLRRWYHHWLHSTSNVLNKEIPCPT